VLHTLTAANPLFVCQLAFSSGQVSIQIHPHAQPDRQNSVTPWHCAGALVSIPMRTVSPAAAGSSRRRLYQGDDNGLG